MSAAAAPQENLDERIERIRKRNEELEKKHREAEEDRLMALKDNAMVKTKMPTDNDWPKGHRYDTLDFTYDQKDAPPTPSDSGDDSGGSKSLGRKNDKTKDGKHGRDYKKFADGEGPPPDPSYNFLADAERDGTMEKSSADKKDWRQPNNGGNANTRNRGGLNNSFRGRNGKPRNGNGSNGGGNHRYQKHDSNSEFNAWKNERERIDEARIGRQKIGDGKWRREWDSDKLNDDESIMKIEKININDSYHGGQQHQHQLPQKSPNHQQQHNHHDTRNGNVPRIAAAELPMEKRGNIMVSVSQDGEVKSVKLQSARAIGTGRVGLRQTPVKNQYAGQKEAYPPVNHFQQQHQLQLQQQQQQQQLLQHQQHLLQQQHQPLPHQYQLQQDHQPHTTQYFEVDTAIVGRPFFDGRPNLQDRLQRHRQPATTPTSIDNVFDGSTNNDAAPIAVSY